MSTPIEYVVRQATDALGRMSEQKGLSWEGGAARAGLDAIRQLQERVHELEVLINTPQTDDFFNAVKLEAAHQQIRWGTRTDAGKEPQDWFWLIGFLAGKAVHGFICLDRKKGLHHIISSAAALLNWHRHVTGQMNAMRPGIDSESLQAPPTDAKEPT
jgi:hypothetical protein